MRANNTQTATMVTSAHASEIPQQTPASRNNPAAGSTPHSRRRQCTRPHDARARPDTCLVGSENAIGGCRMTAWREGAPSGPELHLSTCTPRYLSGNRIASRRLLACWRMRRLGWNRKPVSADTYRSNECSPRKQSPKCYRVPTRLRRCPPPPLSTTEAPSLGGCCKK